mmetsp:Transcript_24510/g.61198  ORF Transcript_24510/g.61198 Transcript_24510/m.61198 type:complete len:210 (+) Transcript_24510:141-770(+)|eukprot:CAMPEP_0174903510 /NCGR_PEP_ID=MMETSP0167-20121228/44108_1 /TAXON_ID=38298 /ORGANISM="Rhodella maculata, Strain CCMP736" /LENGTH=209 /DNA_ID=CAMNT_0016145857 /DNA_START=101 /DNA_END=730 /DNA_ORIENTATION=-
MGREEAGPRDELRPDHAHDASNKPLNASVILGIAAYARAARVPGLFELELELADPTLLELAFLRRRIAQKLREACPQSLALRHFEQLLHLGGVLDDGVALELRLRAVLARQARGLGEAAARVAAGQLRARVFGLALLDAADRVSAAGVFGFRAVFAGRQLADAAGAVVRTCIAKGFIRVLAGAAGLALEGFSAQDLIAVAAVVDARFSW